MWLTNASSQHLACGLIAWTQYTLLATPRHLLNPRFHLTTPLVSGLFYIAPGMGLIIGTILGGRFSDMTVRKWIAIRGGLRMPQDRLNSGMVAFFLIIPATSLIYGWGLQYEVGGLALPIITAFFCGVGLMLAFTSLNTYCAEVLPKNRREVMAGKYLVQYSFAATGSGVIVSIVDAIGVGPAQTIG
jgi:MFS family permease